MESDGTRQIQNISIVFNRKCFIRKEVNESVRWTYGRSRTEGDKQNFAVDVCGQLLLTYKKKFMGQLGQRIKRENGKWGGNESEGRRAKELWGWLWCARKRRSREKLGTFTIVYCHKKIHKTQVRSLSLPVLVKNDRIGVWGRLERINKLYICRKREEAFYLE